MNKELKQIITSKYVINNAIYYSCLYYFPIPTTIFLISKKVLCRK